MMEKAFFNWEGTVHEFIPEKHNFKKTVHIDILQSVKKLYA
jgi:hypothetical protein